MLKKMSVCIVHYVRSIFLLRQSFNSSIYCVCFNRCLKEEMWICQESYRPSQVNWKCYSQRTTLVRYGKPPPVSVCRNSPPDVLASVQTPFTKFSESTILRYLYHCCRVFPECFEILLNGHMLFVTTRIRLVGRLLPRLVGLNPKNISFYMLSQLTACVGEVSLDC